MLVKNNIRLRRWHVLTLLALVFAIAVSAGAAFAAAPTSRSGNGAQAPTSPDSPTAFVYFQPSATGGGTCVAPPNGGSVAVGCRFVLDMMLNGGDNPDMTAQQSYFNYNPTILQNARTQVITTSCTITSIVTHDPCGGVDCADAVGFDASLQNEICNNPAGCTFRGVPVPGGAAAVASGALSNGPQMGVFRIASMGLCAVAAGTTALTWEFAADNNPACANGAPVTRDTQVVTSDGSLVQNCLLYTNYVINVVGPPTNTPTVTNTAPPTNTFTPVPPTSTFTNTPLPTSTNTPVPPTATNTPLPPTATFTPAPDPSTCALADHYFVPVGSFGGTVNCSQATQNCVGTVGSRVLLDLFVHPPLGGDPDGLTAQQAYIDFDNGTQDYNRIQNIRVSTANASCTITGTVTQDQTVFDAVLQNEVCNNQPAGCVFRGVPVGPGSFAFASGALSNGPYFDAADFRVAQTAWCLSAPGTARLRWQFAPPDPITRDTQIVDANGDLGQSRACYVDFTFTIVPAVVDTPTSTNTAVPANTFTATPSNTNTAVPTSTDTAVPTNTNTAVPTSTDTAVPTNTNTAVPTNTVTPVNTHTSTSTPTMTATDTSTSTPSITNTPVPATNTFTAVPATNTRTAVPPTNTRTPVPPTNTFTAVPPTNTRTAVPPTNTFTVTRTPVPPTNTRTPVPPTNTRTPAPPTNTFTPAPPTNTFTMTRTRTATPAVTLTPCDECHVKFVNQSGHGNNQPVTLRCNPDGTLHWTATLNNKPDRDDDPGCVLVIPYRVSLQVHCRGNGDDDDDDDDDGPNQGGCASGHGDGWTTVQVQHGTAFLPARTNVTLQGDFCYSWPNNADKLRVEFALDSRRHGCSKKRKSHYIDVCPVRPVCGVNPTFPDVPSGYVFEDNIQLLASTGVVSGFGDGTFRPNAPINRGQVAKMVVIANGITNAGGDEQHFSDVPTDHPYFSFIQAALSQGLVGGYEDGTFRPYDNVTRGQIAKIVVSAQYLELVTPDMPTFSDVAKDNVFYSYIETAYAHGILSGYADGTFGPNDTATRGQVSKIVSNVFYENE